MAYEQAIISTVAIIRITKAKYTEPPMGDSHPWQASGIVENLAQGSHPSKSITFARGLGSAACDDGHPLPRVNELWAIYFWTTPEGAQQVWQSYPAAVALKADARLRARLPHMRP